MQMRQFVADFEFEQCTELPYITRNGYSDFMKISSFLKNRLTGNVLIEHFLKLRKLLSSFV